MSVTEHAWFIAKIAIGLYLAKVVSRKFLDFVFSFIIYMPNTPTKELKYPDANPEGYRSPADYGYDYDNISVVTKDGLILRGWLIMQPNPKNVQP